MGAMRLYMHENKAWLSVVFMAVSLIVMIMAFYGIPEDAVNDGYGPLAPMRGWNFIIIGLTLISLVYCGYVIYRYVNDKARFEELMNANS
ncbi:MAG: hypothetical protein JSW25_01830, partial [Thermoplasmata archaeon]